MAFNPISIDGEGSLLPHTDSHAPRQPPVLPSPQAGSTRAVLTAANVAALSRSAGVSAGGILPTPAHTTAAVDTALLLTSKTTPSAAIRRCHQRYYFDFAWSVAFPEQPPAPLLYYPDTYKNLLHDPAAIGVMQAELDAMSDGVLERIPLAYYPLQPGVLEEARAVALETERHVEEMQAKAKATGQLERLTWNAEDVNPHLDRADADLLDTDIDSSLVLQRDLPSLTLLQRPLYTDMGLVPQEQRHAARLARIVPEDLRSLSQAAGLPGSPMLPGSPQGPGGAVATFETPEGALTKQREWVQEVQRSFKQARTLDQQYDHFVKGLVHGKLGLDRANPDHVQLARQLWRRLFRHTKSSQQREVWNLLCQFSSTYGEKPHAEAVRELMSGLTEKQSPEFIKEWRPLIREYANCVERYVASLKGGVAERKDQLHFSGAELDPLNTGSFQPELVVERLMRRYGTELGENHAALPIYPLDVIPVFPTGFQEAARIGVTAQRSNAGELDFLAESADTLHHIVLPAVSLGVGQPDAPHVLVNGTNLLVADKQSTVQDVTDGATVSYQASKENTFQPLLLDEDNTSSYIVRLHRVTGFGGDDGDDLVTAGNGAANHEGKYATYDRIGMQDLFTKASNMATPPFHRYVVMYSAETASGTVATGTANPAKRPREEVEDGAANEVERERQFQRAKVERTAA